MPTLLRTLLLAVVPAVHAAPYDFDAADQLIDEAVAFHGLPGASLTIVRDGAVIHERHVGTFDASTRIPIASATKWMSGAVIAGLMQDGVIDWDDTVGEFFPSVAPEKKPITVRQLFSHTSGIAGSEGSCLGFRNVTLAACAASILSEPLAYVPGAGFWYGGRSMQVAGRMAELASGEAWDALFKRYVVEPLALGATDYAAGLDDPGYVDSTNPRIGGGIRSTSRDYVRFVQMMQQRGQLDGRVIFSPDIVAAMQLDQTFGAPIVDTPDVEAYGYGIGVWRNTIDADGNAVQVSSTGAFGFSPWIDVDRRLAVVLAWQGPAGQMQASVKAAWGAVRAAVDQRDDSIGLGFFDSFEY